MAYTPTVWVTGDKVTSARLNKIENGIADKVDKVNGKTLSTNDYTNADKKKIDDISISSPTNGQALVYNSSTQKWENKTISGSGSSISIDDTLTIAGAAADSKETGDRIGTLKENLQHKVASSTLFCDDVEDGYYSNNTGEKLPNSASSTYKRSKNLIPVEEDALYVADRNTMCVCFGKDGTFIKEITIYSATGKFVRETIPTGTTHVGLTATNAPSFTLTKVDASGVKGIEYPYTSEGCIHVPSCWCNGNGGMSSTSNFDTLIIPVKEGEKWYVSNQADYNLLCLDASGTLLEATYETRSPIGKVVTVPTGAKTMYVNLYRARTKGVNSEMSDYVARVDGKKILAIGDSLTWLDGRNGNYGGMAWFSGWQRQLRLAGHDVISAGFSGYPYATGLDIVDGVDYSIYKEIVTNAYAVSGYDMIILFGGTNDVLYNGALGDRPTDYSNRTFDASKFHGALGAIISYIRTNNTTALILLASFPKSEAVTRVYPNARSRVSEIEYNANFWSCKYVNVWSDLNVQPTYDGFDQFFYDATHPNFLGMERIGKIMLDAVEAPFDSTGGGSGGGQDGFSPTVAITDITGGHRVSVTDVDGTKTFDVMDGTNGTNGVSPTITVTAITGGHRISITDATSTTSFDVMDGTGGGDSGGGDSGETTYVNVIPEQTFTPTTDYTALTVSEILIDGQTYRYTVNGVENTGTATLTGGSIVLGSYADYSGGTGGAFECFNNAVYYDTKLRTETTIKVDKVVESGGGGGGSSTYYNPLKGKIAAFTGDSLCYGAGYTGGYAKIIGEDNSMTVQNIGVSEGTVVKYSNRFCISESIPDLREDADYVILEGGGNDAWYGEQVIPLGTMTSGYDDTLDTTTFAGAFESMVKNAINRFPGKKIGYIFPHKGVPNFSSTISGGYYHMIIDILQKWGIPYFDNNILCPPLGYVDVLKNTYTIGDGVHPNELGYRTFYASQIAEWMKTL